MNIFRTRWMPILGLILSLTPIWGYFVVSYELIPFGLSNIFILMTTLVGIIVSVLALPGSHSSDRRTFSGRIAWIGMVIGTFAFVSSAIFYPSAIAMRNRERNSQVKHIIHGLQGCISEYKQTHQGFPPQSIMDLEPTIPGSLKIQNPYKPHQRYMTASGGLIDGIPNKYGIIGYIAPATLNEPYKFIYLERGNLDWDKPRPFFIDENNAVGVFKKVDD
jgi:hypothetical protein